MNRQRFKIDDLYHEGFFDINEHKRLKSSIEFQIKRINRHPPIIAMPKKQDFLRQIPWLECLDPKQLLLFTSSVEDSVFQRGDVLVKQDATCDSVHVLARGTVSVYYKNSMGKQVEIDELGFGSVFGEISWALKCTRGASIIATSPGLMFTIQGKILSGFTKSNIELEKRLWETCGMRLSENLLAKYFQNSGRSRRVIRENVHEMVLFTVDSLEKKIWLNNSGNVIILLQGSALIKNFSNEHELFQAPQVFQAQVKRDQHTFLVEFSTNAIFMCHPLMISRGNFETEFTGSYSNNISSNAQLEYKNSNSFFNQLDFSESANSRRLSLTDLNIVTRFDDNRRKTLDLSEIDKIRNERNRSNTLSPLLSLKESSKYVNTNNNMNTVEKSFNLV